MSAWIADGLTLLGLSVMTVGAIGLWRFPSIYTQVHAASKAAVVGIVPLLAAAAVSEPAAAPKALLVVAFLLLATPVGSHALARAAHLSGEELEEGAVDERAER